MIDLNTLQTKLDKVQKNLDKIAQNGISNENLSDLAIGAEKAFIDVRSFVTENYDNDSNLDLSETKLDDGCISITEGETGMAIVMPSFLPFKKLKALKLAQRPKKLQFVEVYEKCNAILYALDFAFQNYCAKHTINRMKYSKCVFEYTNYFASDNKVIPDADNIEYKQVTDLVISYVSALDDSFDNVDFMFKSRPSDRTYTVLKIIPKKGGGTL